MYYELIGKTNLKKSYPKNQKRAKLEVKLPHVKKIHLTKYLNKMRLLNNYWRYS